MNNSAGYITNYSLWVWDGTDWQPIEIHCDYGYCATKPPLPGVHVGDLCKTPCKPLYESS